MGIDNVPNLGGKGMEGNGVNRREFLKRLAGGAGALFGFSATGFASSAGAAERQDKKSGSQHESIPDLEMEKLKKLLERFLVFKEYAAQEVDKLLRDPELEYQREWLETIKEAIDVTFDLQNNRRFRFAIEHGAHDTVFAELRSNVSFFEAHVVKSLGNMYAMLILDSEKVTDKVEKVWEKLAFIETKMNKEIDEIEREFENYAGKTLNPAEGLYRKYEEYQTMAEEYRKQGVPFDDLDIKTFAENHELVDKYVDAQINAWKSGSGNYYRSFDEFVKAQNQR